MSSRDTKSFLPPLYYLSIFSLAIYQQLLIIDVKLEKVLSKKALSHSVHNILIRHM